MSEDIQRRPPDDPLDDRPQESDRFLEAISTTVRKRAIAFSKRSATFPR